MHFSLKHKVYVYKNIHFWLEIHNNVHIFKLCTKYMKNHFKSNWKSNFKKKFCWSFLRHSGWRAFFTGRKPWFKSRLGPFYMEFAWIFSGNSNFPPRFKNMFHGLIGNSILLLGVCEFVCDPASDW